LRYISDAFLLPLSQISRSIPKQQAFPRPSSFLFLNFTFNPQSTSIIKMSFIDFVRSQWQPLPYPAQSFASQTIIVTGSNTGLGLEAARHFVRLNASKVILAVRSIAKGEEAARSIEQTTGRKGVCEVWQVDIGNFESVKEFCKRVEGLERLDVVVENAGVAKLHWIEMEGMEATIAINVVGTFLMAFNLLPALRKSGKAHGITPRLVITSSEVHSRVRIAFTFNSCR
jgi:retinol dehydrogenase-12